MLEFVISKYITVKLENGKTYIYILGKKFEQCKKLALTIVNNEFEILDELKSIDEIDNYKKLSSEERFPIQISAEEEFWGHCSNLQVWIEHNYDTCLLHSTLAFPLLRKLANSGEIKAKKMLKEEILNRFLSGNYITAWTLLSGLYLDYFTKEERKSLYY